MDVLVLAALRSYMRTRWLLTTVCLFLFVVQTPIDTVRALRAPEGGVGYYLLMGLSNNRAINIMHTAKDFKDVVLVHSLIVTNASVCLKRVVIFGICFVCCLFSPPLWGSRMLSPPRATPFFSPDKTICFAASIYR